MERFERIVECEPAYDRRNPDSSKDYGIGAVRIRFVLKGPKGSVQFLIGTDWYLPAIQPEIDAKDRAWDRANPPIRHRVRPNGWDVGYHSPRPRYKGQNPMDGKCEYVQGGKCYYDGSGLRADEWVKDILLPQGSDGVWKALETEYHVLFTKKKKR